MLFNLQGAHRFQRRAFILPQRFFFVKHFFQVFSSSFVLSFAGLVAEVRCPRGQPNYITTFVFPCQALFSSFFKLFRALSGRTLVVALSSQTAYRGYHSRNHLSSTFFRFSKPKFKRRTDQIPLRSPQTLLLQGFSGPCRKRSLIIATSPPLVNTFFQVFQMFFCCPHICPSAAFFFTRYTFPLTE